MVFPSLNKQNISYDRLPVRFFIERRSDIFTPAGEEISGVCEYPTVIRLTHQKNEEDNGRLLTTFEQWGFTYPIYESQDDGLTWSFLGRVKDDYNGYYNEWMPFLYELPADIGDREEGTVILAATSVTGAGVTVSTITLYESTDLGRSFNAFCNVDKAGGTDWGVWEPFLIYEEESGRLFCFYSDDSDPAHSQKLVYKYSYDLVNWSEKFECVACSDPDLRPGMVSVAKWATESIIWSMRWSVSAVMTSTASVRLLLTTWATRRITGRSYPLRAKPSVLHLTSPGRL